MEASQSPTGSASEPSGAHLNLPQTSKDSAKSGLTHSLTIKLDEKNYLLWNQQVNGVITAHDLHRFIVNPQIPIQFASDADRVADRTSDEYRQWIFKDQTLFTWLLSTLSDSVLPRVLGCKHAFQVWDQIHKYFHSVLQARARQLRSELKNTKKASRSVGEYLLRIKSIVNSLLAVGDLVSDREQVDAILEGLPEEFNSFVMMVYSRFDTPTVEDVEALLLLQEAQFEKFRQELASPSVSAHVALTDSKMSDNSVDQDSHEVGTEHYVAGKGRGRGKGRGKGRSRGRGSYSGGNQGTQCQICSKSSHDAVNCWYRYHPSPSMMNAPRGHAVAHSRPPPYNPPMRPSAHLALPYYTGAPSEASWYPDSGASHHLTYDPYNLVHSNPYTGHDQVMMGNGQGVSINSLGHSSFKSPSMPSVKLELKDLLHVPNISKNLLSVSKFAQDNNVIFEFHPYKCFVKSQASRQILLEGHVGADGLYQFKPFKFIPTTDGVSNRLSSNFSVVNSSIPCHNALYTVPATSEFHKWHLRLGHIHSSAISTVLNLCNVPVSNKFSNESCSFCCIGKSHRLYAPLSHTVYTKPFEVVHTDLWGPAPFDSYYGYRYYITFVDTFTKYTWIYFLKQKSDALLAFKQFHALVQNQFNHTIKAVQSDWGGEFRPFTTFLQGLGILHRLTCPHTSHQNGTVERKHRQIVEMGLTMLSHASLPLKFWDHCFTQAVFIINRVPSSSLSHFKSPYHALFKSHPDYTLLKVFGCLCFPHLRPYHTHKFQFKSSPCVYLGVSPQHKGHKCLDATGRIYISKDVIFHELKFPYVSMFSSSTTPSSDISMSTMLLDPCVSDVQSPQFPLSSPSHDSVPCEPSSSPVPSPTVSPTHSSQSISVPLQSAPVASLPLPTPLPSTIYGQPVISNHNDHSMITRAKTGNLKPKAYLSLAEPKTVKSALSDPQWLAAMQLEYKALMDNNTWSLVPLPPHRRAIGCKWVFRIKENPDGTVNKYKARLVAKGFAQTPGFDFTETFSPVIKPITIRIILTLAVTNKWPVQQIDVNNAFLNGVLQEEVYMHQPAGFENADRSLVCKLHKSLYGLKQAPRAWYEKLTQTLLTFGFVKSKCDPSLLVHSHNGAVTYVLIYVDDILITGSAPHVIQDLIHKLNVHFALKQLGQLDYFLGIEVHSLSTGALLLTQTKYIRDLLCKAKMENSNPIGSPMVSTCRLSKIGTDVFSDATLYRSVVGALQYVTLTRPDIAFSVNKACQFMARPLDSHWKAVKRILRYLKGTLHYGLCISPSLTGPPFSLRAYSDADWATDQDDRRSTSGSCIYFGPNLVSWSSKKQQLVARSSTEAEYRSMANTTADLLWIQSLLQELQVPFHTPTLLCDNLSAVALSHNPVLHSRTKHMELDIHFVRERVISKQLHVLHVPAMDQLADPLTKPLSPSNYGVIRTKLKVFPCTEPT
ncbi:hypothetical protein TSUD_336290 [Trifolium subterraneum]|uniref:Integrase catalytic domain-containing protein n=1 Tax=Trifolium subterraneum TaxID=3900 RepID=A0A2Z6LMP6_TRISU|nr:hypothetical protein TSUD_336290 [Trifolium subterraneum]